MMMIRREQEMAWFSFVPPLLRNNLLVFVVLESGANKSSKKNPRKSFVAGIFALHRCICSTKETDTGDLLPDLSSGS